MAVYEQLSPYEQWMVRSNLNTIRTEGVPVTRQAAALRANGYPRIAEAVEQEHETEREVRLEEERAADLIEWENVRGISAPDF